MLKSITLENYKCFKDETTIDIAPLTVLCGVNSSGKSSILKSLLMMKQSYENNPSKGQIVFSGNYVDNGSFKDVVFNNNGTSFEINTSFIVSDSLNNLNNRKKYSVDKSNFRELTRLYKSLIGDMNIKAPAFIISINLVIAGTVSPKTQIQAIKNTITNYNIQIQIFNADNLKNELYKSDLKIQRCKSGLYLVDLLNFPLISDNNVFESITTSIENCHCYYDGMKLIKIYSSDAPKEYNMSEFLPNIYTLFSIVANQYYNIKHISPLRFSPNRSFTISRSIKDMSPNGEDMIQILAQYGTSKINYSILNNQKEWENKSGTLLSAVQQWNTYLETGELTLSQNGDNIKLNISGHNILDVGTGVSQCLPIIINGLYSPSNVTLMIEQPEIHLHPKMQMNMADFLLSLILQNKQIIIETHSDHIINRLVRRAMEDKNIRNKISIHFIDKNEDCAYIENVIIDEFDGAVCKNEDFFYQFASETEKIIDIGYRNLQKSQEGSNDV